MISVVICSIDRKKFEAVSAQFGRALAGEPCEIVGVHDAKSMCEGYNRGLAASKGDIVLFSHDDLEILAPDFLTRLKGHLAHYDAVGIAGTNRLINAIWVSAYAPHIFGQVAYFNPFKQHKGELMVSIFGAPQRIIGGMQALDGVMLAFRRPVIEALRWDEATFTGFHCYDVDCTFRAYLAGYRLAAACDLALLHFSGGDYGAGFQAHAAAFMAKHGPKLERMEPRVGQFAQVIVPSRAAALAAMTPAYWDDESANRRIGESAT